MYVQFEYLASHVLQRFLWLIGIYVATIIILKIRFHSDTSILEATTNGPSFEMIKAGQLYLPIFWILLLVLPTFIIGDSFNQIHQRLFSQIKSQRFTKNQVGLINLSFLVLLVLGYMGVVQITMILVDLTSLGFTGFLKHNLIEYYLTFNFILFMSLLSLLILQQLCGWIAKILLLLVPTLLVVYTVFSINTLNPLNLTMASRRMVMPHTSIIELLIGSLLLGIAYVSIYGKLEMKWEKIMNLIELTNVSKVVKGRTLLDNVSLTVKKGSITTLEGINGSGKTLILKSILGLIKTTGEVKVNGELVSVSSRFPIRAGALIESPSIIEEFSAFKNLELIARLQGAVNEDSILNLLNKFDLPTDKKNRVRKFSLGMKQKLGIAQAMLGSCELIVLDEPTNALDEESIQKLTIYIREMNLTGSTFLITSHDREFLESITSQRIKVKAGKIDEEA